MWLTDLADACRKSGLKVVGVPGWRTRGHDPMTAIQTIVCHHTATPKTAPGDYPSLGIVRDGRSDLPGPLAQLGLGRNGTVYVIAAGVSYHAGETFTQAQDNWHAIGIEAEHDGISPWPPAQYHAYAQLCRALIDHYRLDPSRVQGHKEVAKPLGRKVDPTFDMGRFRAAIRLLEDDMFSDEDSARLERLEEKVDALDNVTRAKLTRANEALREANRRLEKLGGQIVKGDA